MSITAFDGPVVTFPSPNTTSYLTQSNPEAGPSVFMHGLALADPRQPFSYLPGQNFGKQVSGWVSLKCQTIDQVPYTASAQAIVVATGMVTGAVMPLVSTSGTGITTGVSIVRADTGATVTGLLAIDSAMTTVKFGTAQTIQIWDPTKALARNIRVSAQGTASGATFVIAGYDLYGYPISETITGPVGTGSAYALTEGLKGFKYVASVTSNGTATATGIAIGFGDTFSFPLRADRFTELQVAVGNTAIIASTGFTASVTTTATATSGDIRGTYGLQTSSNGVLRLSVYQSPQVSNCSTAAGLLGVSQYSG